MPRHISIIFPGQGSQAIGMLDNFSTSYLDSYRDIIFDSLGFDLIDIISNGSEEKLNKTSITQPAILLSSFLQYEEFIKKLKIKPNIMCGHSLGEYTALVVSQSLSLSDALSLVHKRGLLMEQCQKGSMCAVLNTDLDVISGVCERVENETNNTVSPANLNSPKQTVISGTTEGVELAIKYLKDAGHKKCIKLNVSVASHSNVMINAIDEFKKELDMINMSMPNHKIIHNVDNESSNDIAELKNKLLNQLTNPVRWSYAMEYIKKHNGIVIECGPNNVLSGLARSNGIDEVYSTFSKNFIDEIKSAL
jgi:[acyl-carrier-protein] S-malonyltransferase